MLHHLPGVDARLGLLRQAQSLLQPGGLFIHSDWQFQHSPRLMARRQPWEMIGLDEEDVEAGIPCWTGVTRCRGRPERTGLRYVHLFTGEELEELARLSGFCR